MWSPACAIVDACGDMSALVYSCRRGACGYNIGLGASLIGGLANLGK